MTTRNRFLTDVRFLLLPLLFHLLISCSNRGYNEIGPSERKVVASVFSKDFQKAVYKTNFDLYNRSITGLTIIKGTDSSFRLISMSELGLKYFDIEYYNDSKLNPKVYYVMDLLNKEILIKRLIFNLGLLFHFPESSVFVKSQDGYKLYRSGSYQYNTMGESVRSISEKSFLGKKKVVMRVGYNNDHYPDSIAINRSKIKIGLIKLN